MQPKNSEDKMNESDVQCDEKDPHLSFIVHTKRKRKNSINAHVIIQTVPGMVIYLVQ